MTFTRTCEYCGATFTAAREHARFCSARHRVYWNREHPAGVTRPEAPAHPAGVTRNEADQEARVKALLDALHTCVSAGGDRVSLLSADLLLALRADLGSDWVPGHRLDEYETGYGRRPVSTVTHHYMRTAGEQRGGRGGEWIRLDDAWRLIVSAARDAFEVAADEFEFEARRELRVAEEEAVRARAAEALHDAPIAPGDPTPARGTRDALVRFTELVKPVTARDAQSFARRTRRAERDQLSAELDAVLEAAQELTDWATEARDQLDELA